MGREAGVRDLSRSTLARSGRTYRSGNALRTLPETAAMFILARHVASRKLKRTVVYGLANTGAAGVPGSHGMVMSRVFSHCRRGMHMASMHKQHRRQGHFSPSHHAEEQYRCDEFLKHPVSSIAGLERQHRDEDHTSPGSVQVNAARANRLRRTVGLSQQILKRGA